MTKTAGGNPVIGTVACSDIECDQQATVHQVARGTRKGQLYLRCPECGCDQRKAKSLQKHIRTKADFREGFEHLAETGTGSDQETESTDNQSDETTTDEAEAPAKEGRGNGLLAVAGVAVVSVVGLALGLGGKK